MKVMMQVFWLLLLLGNLSLMLKAIDEIHYHPSATVILVFAVSLGNLFYMGRTANRTPSKSRLGRLISLWFDAKERELKKRDSLTGE